MERVTITWGAGRACMALNMEEVAECYSTTKFKKLLRCVVGVSDNREDVLREMHDQLGKLIDETEQTRQFEYSRYPALLEKRAEAQKKMMMAEYYKTFTIRENAVRDWKEAVKEYNREERAVESAKRKLKKLVKHMEKLVGWKILLEKEGAIWVKR